MIHFDPNSVKPIYEQIVDQFIKLIGNQVLKPDEQLPSVRELASSVRINPNTIQRAYKLLESRNYIYSVPGKGNFVSPNQTVLSAEISRAEKRFKNSILELKKLGVGNSHIVELTHMTLKGVENHAKNTILE